MKTTDTGNGLRYALLTLFVTGMLAVSNTALAQTPLPGTGVKPNVTSPTLPVVQKIVPPLQFSQFPKGPVLMSGAGGNTFTVGTTGGYAPVTFSVLTSPKGSESRLQLLTAAGMPANDTLPLQKAAPPPLPSLTPADPQTRMIRLSPSPPPPPRSPSSDPPLSFILEVEARDASGAHVNQKVTIIEVMAAGPPAITSTVFTNPQGGLFNGYRLSLRNMDTRDLVLSAPDLSPPNPPQDFSRHSTRVECIYPASGITYVCDLFDFGRPDPEGRDLFRRNIDQLAIVVPHLDAPAHARLSNSDTDVQVRAVNPWGASVPLHLKIIDNENPRTVTETQTFILTESSPRQQPFLSSGVTQLPDDSCGGGREYPPRYFWRDVRLPAQGLASLDAVNPMIKPLAGSRITPTNVPVLNFKPGAGSFSVQLEYDFDIRIRICPRMLYCDQVLTGLPTATPCPVPAFAQ